MSDKETGSSQSAGENLKPTSEESFKVGLRFQKNGEVDKAIEAYRKALEDPDFQNAGYAWNNLGMLLGDKGELDDSIKAFHKALEKAVGADRSETLNNLGTVLKDKGQFDEAIKCYEEALKEQSYKTPGYAWNNLGVAFRGKGKLDEAIAACHKALESPGYDTPGKAWNNIANALGDRGDVDGAIKAYQKALDDPNYKTPGIIWRNIARTYLGAGKYDVARETLEKALRDPDPSDPDHGSTKYLLTLVQSKLKPSALTPDDRALVEKPGSDADVDSPELRLIDKVKAAGETQYEQYLKKPDSKRNNVLSVLRGWSSAVTLLEGSERKWRGGGYFVKWQGCGVVIDPGFDFLRNFHDQGFHGREIDAVIVSHNHPDHNDDLKPIDDLRYELYKRLVGKKTGVCPYSLLWDEDTARATKFSTEHPQHQHTPIAFSTGFPQPFDLSKHKAQLPVRVVSFKVNHSDDVPSAMGMVVELLEKEKVVLRIGYTGDTEYFEELSVHLKGCDILIVHISQPSVEELQSAKKFKKDHLGYRGTARLLRECQPKFGLIGEFWAGFTDLRIDLVKGIRSLSGCQNIFPAGIGMHVSLPELAIECTDCAQVIRYDQMKVAPPSENFGDLAYLCPKCILG
jgi:Tfp pilus assembly protein PilF/ribonuclease BN (tRNA processing enzyme)